MICKKNTFKRYISWFNFRSVDRTRRNVIVSRETILSSQWNEVKLKIKMNALMHVDTISKELIWYYNFNEHWHSRRISKCKNRKNITNSSGYICIKRFSTTSSRMEFFSIISDSHNKMSFIHSFLLITYKTIEIFQVFYKTIRKIAILMVCRIFNKPITLIEFISLKLKYWNIERVEYIE